MRCTGAGAVISAAEAGAAAAAAKKARWPPALRDAPWAGLAWFGKIGGRTVLTAALYG